jgi:hypothetical protein
MRARGRRILPRNVLYYGRDEPLPERKALRAGPLSLLHERGDLRYIKIGEKEILRRVYVAIRDRHWGTVLPVLSAVQMTLAADSFEIAYEAVNKQDEIDFYWRGTITGNAQGKIVFTMDGVARSTFWRGRIGFCILHPIRECAGQPCTVEKVDGTVEQGMFPELISPHQPFFDMRAISHEVMPGLWAEVRFEGDVFEMEDQRNWTDASYKIYSMPLALPYPVEVQKGTVISQSVTLTLLGRASADRIEVADRRLTFSVGQAPVGPLPRLGLGLASHGRALEHEALTRLKALNLAHLRVDLHLSQPGYELVLRRAIAEAEALGVRLEIALFVSDAADDELRALALLLDRVGPPVCTWLVFHEAQRSTAEKWIQLAQAHLADFDSQAKIGGGTNAFFAELNRGRPPVQALDLVCYSLNPQVHAFDNASLVETLETQRTSVECARRFCGDLPLAVSPVTLKIRPKGAALQPMLDVEQNKLPAHVDVRQMSLFGAGWTVGSLKYLSESRVYSATYYETSGWCGVMETESGSPLPDKFQSLPGSVFPIYHILADVGEFAQGRIVPCQSSDTLKVDGLAVQKDNQRRILVANLSSESFRLVVRGLKECVRVRKLNDTNAQEAMLAPEAFRLHEGQVLPASTGRLELELLPYAIARIDTI